MAIERNPSKGKTNKPCIPKRRAQSLGVVYLLTQMNLAARLVVSIYHLRHWYDGPITLFTTRPESHEIGELCSREPKLTVTHERCVEELGSRYQSAYLTKANLANRLPYKQNVFLDADTLAVDDISQLFQSARESPLTVTNFLGRSTTQKPFSDSIRSWRKIQNSPGDKFKLKAKIDQLLTTPYPAINTGVIAFQRDKAFARQWNAMAKFGNEMMTPDEVGLQLLLPELDHHVLCQEYNLFPAAYHRDLRPRIWHFASNTHLLAIDGPSIWEEAYNRCATENIANLRAWSKLVKSPKNAAIAK